MNINMDDNFYDDIPSFMPTADDDYCLNDDIDEILRSTDSHLDASLGLDNFSAFGANTFDGKLTENYEDKPNFNSTLDNLDNFDFGGFSSPTSSTPTTLSDHDTPPHTSSQRSTSTCSMDGEALNFNPEGFHNFFNNKQDYGIMIQDDIKIDDEFIPPYAHSMMAMNNAPIRNTPSPSGSCSSSGGSSTSGIQSDASSILEHATTMSSSSISELQPIKMETDVPVSVKIETDETPIKVQPLKINRIPAVKMPIAMDNARKTMPPPAQTPTLSQTTKPKTIFLSSGDFKALMQKVNSTTATNTVATTKMGNSNNNNNNKKIINGQMPKIIMKTKNGQFVTANKLGQSKIMKTTTAGQLLIKQANNFNINNKMMTIPASKTSSVSSMLSSPAAAATTTTTAPPTATSMATKTNVSSYKGMVDEKMFKKQQRMIKNRESASLSRKKKKEYVVSLETRITDLEKENYTLKGENKSLRSQLAALAQTCQCNHGNVGDFILNTLNMSKKVATTTTTTTFAANLNNNKNHNNQHHQQQNHNKINHVQNQINNKNTHNNNHNVVSSSYNHVKIAPKPLLAGKCLKQRITGTATMKKNVAVLFAMAFMVTLNVGHFQNYFNNRMALDSDLEILDDSNMLSTNNNNNNNNGNMLVDGGAVGRRLLWVPSESEHQEQLQEQLLQRNKRATDLEVPPLHFLRPLQHHNKINNNNNNSRERNKLLDEVELMDNETPLSTTTTTSTSFNQTENLRLASNLQKWIDGNDFLNLTDKTLGGDILNMGFKLPSSSDYLLHDIQQQKQQPSQQQKQQEQQKQVKRKLFMSTAGDNNSNNKQGKFDDYDDDLERSNNNNVKNSIDVFKPKINEEYLRLFRTIKRRDDTFYVLSFNMDHVLLPASMYNKSTRPKMSLMLPAGDPTNNGDIVLMQIDCEVVNTTEIELKKHMIPEKLRPGGQKYQGAATVPPRTPQPHVNHNDEYKKLKQKQPENINNTREEVEGPKQKPIVRTYYMMGPRTEQAAAELQKHNQNKDEIEPMFKRDELLVERNNATLFSRMRDTIRGDFHKNLLN